MNDGAPGKLAGGTMSLRRVPDLAWHPMSTSRIKRRGAKSQESWDDAAVSLRDEELPPSVSAFMLSLYSLLRWSVV